MPAALDPLDLRILAVLQRNGRISNNDLAQEVGLSPSPAYAEHGCWRTQASSAAMPPS